MEELVRREISVRDSVQKSLRYLRHLRTDLSGEDALRNDALALYRAKPTRGTPKVLSWGMTTATYPFLNDVAVARGRMLRVQPEVKLEQLLRRLADTHGEKETVRRSGRYSLSLLADLGFVERTPSTGCYRLAPPVRLHEPRLAVGLLRAWIRVSAREDSVDRSTLEGAPALAFFDAPALVSHALQSGALAVERPSLTRDTLRLVD